MQGLRSMNSNLKKFQKSLTKLLSQRPSKISIDKQEEGKRISFDITATFERDPPELLPVFKSAGSSPNLDYIARIAYEIAAGETEHPNDRFIIRKVDKKYEVMIKY